MFVRRVRTKGWRKQLKILTLDVEFAPSGKVNFLTGAVGSGDGLNTKRPDEGIYGREVNVSSPLNEAGSIRSVTRLNENTLVVNDFSGTGLGGIGVPFRPPATEFVAFADVIGVFGEEDTLETVIGWTVEVDVSRGGEVHLD